MDFSSVLTGQIDIGTCANILSKSLNENLIPLAGAVGALFVLLIAIAAMWAMQNLELKLVKDFLRREKMLNKFEDWKRERKLE
jgi:hypothetical protein